MRKGLGGEVLSHAELTSFCIDTFQTLPESLRLAGSPQRRRLTALQQNLDRSSELCPVFNLVRSRSCSRSRRQGGFPHEFIG